MAIEIYGTIKALTGFSVASGTGLHDVALYPEGRHLRGAFGWIACKLNLGIQKYFPDFQFDGVLFRDCIPMCRCKKPYVVSSSGELFCPRCKSGYSPHKVINFIRAKKVRDKEVVDGYYYRLSIIVQDKALLDDIRKLIKFVQDYGVTLGRRLSSGYGRFALIRYEIKEVQPLKAHKAQLQSHMITSDGRVPLTISKKVNDKFELVNLKCIPKGTIIKNVSGFYAGEYGGLGFGEFIPVE